MDDYGSLSHTKWECKYHVVFIPKCRRKTLYGELRKHLGEVFRGLAEQKESRIEEGHLMVDHVHMRRRISVSTSSTCGGDGHLQVVSMTGAALAALRQAALSGSQSKARLCRGILTGRSGRPRRRPDAG